MEPRPYTIQVPEAILADLRERLSRARWPDDAPDAGWRYGTDLAYLQGLVAYWRDRYDWRPHEAALNAFRNFTVPLDGIDLHFIHQPSVGPAPLPLLLSHGWPGSVWEFHKVIPLLTDLARFGGTPPTPSRSSLPRSPATASLSGPVSPASARSRSLAPSRG